jgi:hypothetical protein
MEGQERLDLAAQIDIVTARVRQKVGTVGFWSSERLQEQILGVVVEGRRTPSVPDLSSGCGLTRDLSR